MQVLALPQAIELILFDPEAALLESVLIDISDAYNRPPQSLHVGIRHLWFPGEGLRAAEMSDEDIEVWTQTLAEIRSQNGQLCETWIKALNQAAGQQPRRITISYEDADRFLNVINDYRLLQAAEHNVGEADMEKPLESEPDPQRQGALLEIHFLGWLIELMLSALNRRCQAS